MTGVDEPNASGTSPIAPKSGLTSNIANVSVQQGNSHQYCSAFNCKKRKCNNPGLSFFRFPKDKKRCKQWVINSGRTDLLNKDTAYLHRNRSICSEHFEDKMFRNDLKNRLVPSTAVPTIFNFSYLRVTNSIKLPQTETPLGEQIPSPNEEITDIEEPRSCVTSSIAPRNDPAFDANVSMRSQSSESLSKTTLIKELNKFRRQNIRLPNKEMTDDSEPELAVTSPIASKRLAINAKMSSSHQYCSAINCKNRRCTHPNLSYFRFPKDKEICKQWVINSQREDLLDKDAAYLNKNLALCSQHFEINMFRNRLRKNRLQLTAIPTIFNFQQSSKNVKINRKYTKNPPIGKNQQAPNEIEEIIQLSTEEMTDVDEPRLCVISSVTSNGVTFDGDSEVQPEISHSKEILCEATLIEDSTMPQNQNIQLPNKEIAEISEPKLCVTSPAASKHLKLDVIARKRSGTAQQYCSAINCKNRRCDQPKISFFQFPNDKERSKQWVINSGRHDLLSKDAAYLNTNCAFCSLHFEDKMFQNHLRNRLQSTAVPTIFNVLHYPKLVTISRTLPTMNAALEPSKQTTSEIEEIQLPTEEMTDAVDPRLCVIASYITPHDDATFDADALDVKVQSGKLLSTEIPCESTLIKELSKLRWQNRALRKRIASVRHKDKPVRIEPVAFNYLQRKLSPDGFKFMKLILGKPQQWQDKEKFILLYIYYSSRQGYSVLQKLFQLPPTTTLDRWMTQITSSCGISQWLILQLKEIAAHWSSLEKVCVLTVNEIAIKPGLHYNSKLDVIFGFEDLGNSQRTEKLANSALVFHIHGAIHKWAQPLGYYFISDGCKAEQLKSLLLSALKMLKESGFHVVTIVCDQPSIFEKVAQDLGITDETPYFYSDGEGYIVMYDVPQLLISIRNLLYKYDVKIGDQLASWSDIVNLYHEDQKKPFPSARKLTCRHLDVNEFSKMKVSLAAQVLSDSVSVGITLLVSAGIMPQKAAGTAKFCEMFDHAFHCMNGSSVKSGHATISENSFHFNFLSSFKQWLKQCQFLDTSGKDITEQIDCVNGWLISTSAVTLIWDELLSKYDLKSLTEWELNQDRLKHLFSEVHRSCGSNDKPNALQFAKIFKRLSFQSIMKFESKHFKRNGKNSEVSLELLTQLIPTEVRSLSSYLFEDAANPD